MVTLDFLTAAGDFLAAAGEHLAQDPVMSTVVATVAQREAFQPSPEDRPYWYVVVRSPSGDVVSAGMRTAAPAPYPAFLLPMPDAAALALARALHERGEVLGGVNGALPAVRVCAEETARLTGLGVSVLQHTRLFRLGTLVPPAAPAAGSLRRAVADDLDLALAWFESFMADADEQAGRPRGSSPHETRPEDVLRKIDSGWLWFWVDETGERVHLTGANPPAYGVARIGPVYTPPAFRARGYASAAVHEVSRLIRGSGAEVCLFTDQANPTSNRIYEAIGYEKVVDMANLLVS